MDLQIFLMIVCMGGLVYLILLQVQIAQLKQENKKLANEVQAYLEMHNELKRKRQSEKAEGEHLLELFLDVADENAVNYYLTTLQDRGAFDKNADVRQAALEQLRSVFPTVLKRKKENIRSAEVLHEIDINNI